MQTGTVVIYSGDSEIRSARRELEAKDFVSQAYFGLENVASALKRVRSLTAITPFQTETWLRHTYEQLTPNKGHEACLVVVRSKQLDMDLLALPLVVADVRGLKTAGFPDYGIADYGAPILSPDVNWNMTPEVARRLSDCLVAALHNVAHISLTNMPYAMNGLPNPLAALASTYPSAHERFIVSLDDDVDALLASRGKKYRKEAERCYRLLEDAGPWSFVQARKQHEIEAVFTTLQKLQAQKWLDRAVDYKLNEPAISAAYRANLNTTSQSDGAQIFQLLCGDTPIAVLYGVEYKGTFTLLRIASAQGKWRRLSAGRLVVLEAMRHFHKRGVATFDLGIGGYDFKRGLGARSDPLLNLDYAIAVRARPRVMLMQVKGWVRRHPRLLAGLRRVRGTFKT